MFEAICVVLFRSQCTIANIKLYFQRERKIGKKFSIFQQISLRQETNIYYNLIIIFVENLWKFHCKFIIFYFLHYSFHNVEIIFKRCQINFALILVCLSYQLLEFLSRNTNYYFFCAFRKAPEILE